MFSGEDTLMVTEQEAPSPAEKALAGSPAGSVRFQESRGKP